MDILMRDAVIFGETRGWELHRVAAFRNWVFWNGLPGDRIRPLAIRFLLTLNGRGR